MTTQTPPEILMAYDTAGLMCTDGILRAAYIDGREGEMMALSQALALLHKEAFGAEAWSAESLHSSLSTPGTSLVCLARDGSTLGMLMVRASGEEAEVLTLCIHLTMRRRHLAQYMVTQMHTHLAAQGVKQCFLEVADDNAPAINLYTRLGYKEVKRRRDYYRNPQTGTVRDALILAAVIL